MTTTTLNSGENGRFLLIGGALPALLVGLALLIAGLSFIPASQRPTSGIADLGPGFAFFFTIVLLPAGILMLGLVLMSRLPLRPLAILGSYGNLLLGILWVAGALWIGARDQQWLAGIMGALPGGLFLLTGWTGLAGWAQRGMVIPGWSMVTSLTLGLLLVAAILGLVSGFISRSGRVVLAEAGSPPVRGLAWLPSSGLLLSGDENGRLQQWQNSTATTVSQFEEQIVAIAVSPQNTAVALSLPEKVMLLNPTTWETQNSLPLPAGETASRLLWSPDGKLLAVEISDKTVLLFAVDTNDLVHTLETEVGGIGQGLTWSPDSSKLAYAVGGGYIIIWDVVTGMEVANWRPNGRMDSIAWSPDGTKLAYYHISSIRLLEATTGHLLDEFGVKTEADLRQLAWSVDGTKLAGGSENGEVVVLDAGNGRSLDTFIEHGNMILDLVWSPDGEHLATSSRDGQLIMWAIR
ncbi:MAG: hypothetical protein GY805_13760 [Chloroflexi bacterium]|nr:hypothetical protein [Chloroflexota bacterium]